MDIYLLAIFVLILLALIDLSVGVSNDAVNFLNSAIGSRVATRRTILIVASLGVMVGALFSSGIMEVARKGIFNPEMFTFANVMIVFLAVMIADVLLLDTFNTFGLPTSTTVSIVFELLGAATAVAAIHVINTPGAPSVLEFINSDRALLIIGGIGLSVVVAFLVGTVVQFISRFLFTFDDSRKTAGMQIVWGALALTMITDFLLIKGLKGVSFIPAEALDYIKSNTFVLLVGVFAAWLIITTAIQRSGRNPLVFVVMVGTFALAMAFASNDLVNFIGVPLAGLESWRAWSASGLAPENLMMESLREPVQGDTIYLVIAGIIMATTLWFSSKARSVTETEVSLGRQDEGSERFKPGPLSRGLVRFVLASGEGLRALTPKPWRTEIARRFEREEQDAQRHDAPAFDLVRASVNLAVASILIAIATSMKLPLSTTFVSFMVAMGTSLADRAWGRDSATYRVAGVLSVLSGWFLTAAAAFLLAAFIAIVLSVFGLSSLIAVVAIVGLILYYSHRYHRLRSQLKEQGRAKDSRAFEQQTDLIEDQMSEVLLECSDCVDLAIQGLLNSDQKLLEKARRRSGDLEKNCSQKELLYVRVLKRVQPDIDHGLLGHVEILACQQDLFDSVGSVVENARNHLLNAHDGLTDDLTQLLAQINEKQRQIVALQVAAWQSHTDDRQVSEQLSTVNELLGDATRTVVNDLYQDVRPVKSTTLVLTMLVELTDFVRDLDRSRHLCNHYASVKATVKDTSPPSGTLPVPATP